MNMTIFYVAIGALCIGFVGMSCLNRRLLQKCKNLRGYYHELLNDYEKQCGINGELARAYLCEPVGFEVEHSAEYRYFVVEALHPVNDDAKHIAAIKYFKYFNNPKDEERALNKANKLADRLNYELNKNKKK